jgi:hypothetical protein
VRRFSGASRKAVLAHGQARLEHELDAAGVAYGYVSPLDAYVTLGAGDVGVVASILPENPVLGDVVPVVHLVAPLVLSVRATPDHAADVLAQANAEIPGVKFVLDRETARAAAVVDLPLDAFSCPALQAALRLLRGAQERLSPILRLELSGQAVSSIR